MIGLYLLAAHLVGDFVLQTRWQAAGKFRSELSCVELRAKHVLAYSLPFIPIAIVFSASAWRAGAFFAGLYGLHFATDSRRFRSTLGDVVGWWFASPAERTRQVGESCGAVAMTLSIPPKAIYAYPPLDVERKLPLPANPWPPIAICIDQALHVSQIALLGGLFLS